MEDNEVDNFPSEVICTTQKLRVRSYCPGKDILIIDVILVYELSKLVFIIGFYLWCRKDDFYVC